MVIPRFSVHINLYSPVNISQVIYTQVIIISWKIFTPSWRSWINKTRKGSLILFFSPIDFILLFLLLFSMELRSTCYDITRDTVNLWQLLQEIFDNKVELKKILSLPIERFFEVSFQNVHALEHHVRFQVECRYYNHPKLFRWCFFQPSHRYLELLPKKKKKIGNLNMWKLFELNNLKNENNLPFPWTKADNKQYKVTTNSHIFLSDEKIQDYNKIWTRAVWLLN